MKIIAGQYRGRNLFSPKGSALRPTSDKAREAMFNILMHGMRGFSFVGSKVLDLFCGTGALGIEALSRGAAHTTFVDISPVALELTKKNLEAICPLSCANVLKVDLRNLSPSSFLLPECYQLVFLDAPYGDGLTKMVLTQMENASWLSKTAKIIVEIAKNEELVVPEFLKLIESRTYGKAKILFLECSCK